MKHQHFDVGTVGFYGAYWACAGGSDCAVIAMIGDDPEDRLARSAVKWLCGRGINVLTMSPAKKDYGHHNYPLERIEAAISWLKANGNHKIGIAGASTTGTLALTAAAMFPDVTLTIAMTPSDFVWQGFMQGKRDGCKEWPVEGESLFSYRGKPLPYMPFCYQHPNYWHCDPHRWAVLSAGQRENIRHVYTQSVLQKFQVLTSADFSHLRQMLLFSNPSVSQPAGRTHSNRPCDPRSPAS